MMSLLLLWGFIKVIKKVFILLIFNCLVAQITTNNSFNNSKAVALAGSAVSNPGGIENIVNNPANLSFNSTASISAGSIIFYEMDELLEYQYCSILYKPNKNTNLSLTMQHLGVDAKPHDGNVALSSERAIMFSHGFTLFRDRNSSLRMGYNANYFLLKQGQSAGVSGDGTDGIPAIKRSKVGLDVGIWASLRGKVFLGAFIKNINSPSIGTGSFTNFLPKKINIGFSYIPIKKLITSFSYERLAGSTANHFRFGIEYEIHKYFTLSTGIQMKPNRLGVGFLTPINDNSSFSYSFLSHPTLPLTHSVQIGLHF